MRPIDRDVDPEIVAAGAASRAAWLAKIGQPKRCKTGEVHPSLYECLFCGAIMGESCKISSPKGSIR